MKIVMKNRFLLYETSFCNKVVSNRTIKETTQFPIQFLLRQAFADDEASTRLFQILLFLLLSTASLMFIPCAVRSSFTFSIHFFGCLPLLLVPSTCPYSATTCSLFPSILVMCSNHVSLLFLILSTNVTCCPSSFLVTLFRILSLLDLPSILRSQLISATSILLSSSFLRHQNSDPYIINGMTNAFWGLGHFPPGHFPRTFPMEKNVNNFS